MPKTSRSSLVALAVFVALALAQPAQAEESLPDARRKREATRQRQAQVAAELDAMQASDAQLESAVGVLTGQVKAQEASAEAASQAVEAAMAAVARAQARIAHTEKRLAELRVVVAARAVSAYVRPQDQALTGVMQAKDLGEASRRNVLLNQVNNTDLDIMDQLRSVGEDLNHQQDQLEQARRVAEERRRAQGARLAALVRVQQDHQRLAAVMQGRIAHYSAEAEQVAKVEAGLSALITSQEQALAAQAAAQAQAEGARGRAGVAVGPSRGAADPGSDGRVSGAGLIWPLRGPVTSPFGSRWGRMHTGIDISGGTGTPIRAAKAGTVIFAGTMGGYGNTVVINHGGGLSTLYAHQSRLGTGNGASVGQGQVIGFVGSTGHSTGSHLHFETRVNGSPQNPMRYLP